MTRPAPGATRDHTHDAVAAACRIEFPRLVAALVRVVRDVGRAEELAQDAIVEAIERWPTQGVPDSPGAWLLATARNRAIDSLRRDAVARDRTAQLGREQEQRQGRDPGVDPDALDLDLQYAGDDQLRLLFVTCHPELGPEARVALTLRLLGGLTTPEIARACLVPEPTMGQRISRARRRLAELGPAALEPPAGDERAARLGSVCAVVYLVFNEGYAASSGSEWMRPALCDEALRLGRRLVSLAPDEGEVLGLLALMELQASRFPARRGPDGEPVLLLDQDRSRWDRLLIRRGLDGLERALARSGSDPGPYAIQAAIAACHARATSGDRTDWAQIVGWYGRLAQLVPSPVVELNRAVAVSMSDGPAAALPLVDALVEHPAMARYHLLPSVRGDLLRRLGREQEARAQFAAAAAMCGNERERALLERRAAGEH